MGGLFGGSLTGNFLGLPAELNDGCFADIVLMGAPVATPYRSVGPYCADAPDAIRSAFGWPGVLDHHDFDLDGTVLHSGTTAVDIGNLSFSETDFAANRETIRASVAGALDNGSVPLVLGGDDSTPIPVLQAYEKHGPITVLQFDAHIDWRDEVSGERMGLSSNMRRASEMPWVERIVQVGARGIGSARPADVQDALDWGVHFVSMSTYVAQGLASLMAHIPDDSKVFVTFDIDCMDPSVVPAVIGPAPGGFHYWQVIEILRKLADKARIAGFDLVELMPANDIGGRGALVAARLVAVMMGLISRQKQSRL